MARILVIDDEESVCYLLQELLTNAGHQVLTATNGNEGMNLCNRNSIDLVVTDIYMPEMEGLEFIQKIRKKCMTVKIIAISGGSIRTGVDFLKAARFMGADFSLQKPVNSKQLLYTVSSLVPDA